MVVDKSGSRVRSMFGEIANRYDTMNHVLSGGTDYYWRRVAVKKATIDGNDPILDVCTGTGDLALAYWRRGRGKVPVVGTDFTHEMLEIANEKLARQSKKNLDGQPAPLQFLEADTMQLPFADDQFQLVTVAFGLRNVAETQSGLNEMTRVCKPGGRVVVLEFSLPTSRLIRSVYCWYFRNILPRIGHWFTRNSHCAYEYLPQSVAEFPQGEALADMMKTAGMDLVTYHPLTFGIATLYIGRKSESPVTSSQEIRDTAPIQKSTVEDDEEQDSLSTVLPVDVAADWEGGE